MAAGQEEGGPGRAVGGDWGEKNLAEDPPLPTPPSLVRNFERIVSISVAKRQNKVFEMERGRDETGKGVRSHLSPR